MKVLLYGCDRTVRKAELSLAERGDDPVVVCGYSNVAELGSKGGFALAVVDMAAPEATRTCQYLKQNWGIPVVVILGSCEEGWGKLDEVKVDGYIPRTVGQAEIMARLKAIQRRVPKVAADKGIGAR